MADDQRLTPNFPQSVHDSLAELRRLSKAVKSRAEWQAVGRRATEEEQRLAIADHQPWMCAATSARTGLVCTAKRLLGMTVCLRHGGSVKRTRLAAANRLREATMPVLNRLIETAMQSENLNAQVKAAQHLLNAAGIGAEVEARIRSSRHRDRDEKVVVTIGFMGAPHDAPVTIAVPPTLEDPDA